MAGSALVFALMVPTSIASGQTQPSPAPATRAQENAAIVTPLAEIGRVRSRTPYCGALARARSGIDSAITFEYTMPIVASDVRRFRLDSYLTKAQSLKKTERDLTGLWNLAVAGRDDVRALRAAANAEVDAQKRKEMLEFADALDGAKVRQMWLAKSLARVVAVLAETPVRDIANTPSDDSGGGALASRFADQHPIDATTANAPPVPRGMVGGGQTTTEDQQDHARLQGLFGTLPAEEWIRKDLQDAARHGSAAMQLGGCANNNEPLPR